MQYCGNGTWVWQFSVKNWKLCCSNQCEIDSGINISKFFFIFYCFNLVYLFYFFSICNFVMFVPTAVLWDFTREHANTCNNNNNTAMYTYMYLYYAYIYMYYSQMQFSNKNVQMLVCRQTCTHHGPFVCGTLAWLHMSAHLPNPHTPPDIST